MLRESRGRDQREVRVLRRRPDQRDDPFLDRREEHVLLGLGPPMDLVHEQHRPEQPTLGLRHHLPGVRDPGGDRR
jgi:hypothetical protein